MRIQNQIKEISFNKNAFKICVPEQIFIRYEIKEENGSRIFITSGYYPFKDFIKLKNIIPEDEYQELQKILFELL